MLAVPIAIERSFRTTGRTEPLAPFVPVGDSAAHPFPSPTMPTRARVLSTTTLLIVADLPRSLAFYDKLGFTKPSVHGEPPCFAMSFRDGYELMLSCGEGQTPRPNGPSGVWDMYVRVDDVAAELWALAAAGVAIDKGPTDLFYQMREIEVLDPDGHRICFAQDIS